MSNDNCYYNGGNPRQGNYGYGGNAPTPPPFPGDRRNRGHEWEPGRGYGMPGGRQGDFDEAPRYNDSFREQWGRQRGAMAPPVQQSNSMGTAGFVLSLVNIILWWIPYVGWLIWVLAIVFSAIGMSRKPRGLATAGLIIAIGIPVLFLVAVIALGISLAALGGTGFADI